MKNLNESAMENVSGGYACSANNPGIGNCFPELCEMVSALTGGMNPNFQVCPL